MARLIEEHAENNSPSENLINELLSHSETHDAIYSIVFGSSSELISCANDACDDPSEDPTDQNISVTDGNPRITLAADTKRYLGLA